MEKYLIFFFNILIPTPDSQFFHILGVIFGLVLYGDVAVMLRNGVELFRFNICIL